MRTHLIQILLFSSVGTMTAQDRPVYTYSVPSPTSTAGYSANGNLLSYSDSINGAWSLTYDALNRLQSANVASGPYLGLGLSLTYDSFGNRLTQSASGPPSSGPVQNAWANYDVHNHLTTSNMAVGGATFDLDGNMTNDGKNQYQFDAEGKVCAVSSNGLITQYLYDAGGNRVAKGHSRSNPGALVCPIGDSDFISSSTYVIGLTGEQVTEFDATDSWIHTNVFSEGVVIATYDKYGTGLHFHLSDPIGTRRLQVSSNGMLELSCSNSPFGDLQQCSGPGYDSTEQHFTGKERDAESGLDYFGARYYSSNMGRFSSPDPSGLSYADLGNPQSLNLYSYAQNNPLTNVDPTGLDCVYLNSAGTGIDRDENGNVTGLDQNTDSAECGVNHGYYVEGRADTLYLDSKSNAVGLTGLDRSTGLQTQSPIYNSEASVTVSADAPSDITTLPLAGFYQYQGSMHLVQAPPSRLTYFQGLGACFMASLLQNGGSVPAGAAVTGDPSVDPNESFAPTPGKPRRENSRQIPGQNSGGGSEPVTNLMGRGNARAAAAAVFGTMAACDGAINGIR